MNSMQKWECSTCSKTFTTKSFLKQHVVTHDPNAKVKCGICGKILKNSVSLTSHMYKLHSNRQRPSCEICQRVFFSTRALQGHIDAFHSTRERPRWPCEFLGCEKTFVNKHSVTRHFAAEHAPNPVRLPCTLCGKDFQGKVHLKSHIYTHMGEKPFKCATCGRGFAQKSAKKRHEEVHWETSAREMFQCQVCPRTFLAKQSLQYHIRASHEDQRNYPCKFSLQRFATSSLTKRHVDLRHPTNKEKIYSCDKCEYKSRSEADVAAHHLARHNDADGHVCYFCGRQFSYFGQLVRHCSRAHTLEK